MSLTLDELKEELLALTLDQRLTIVSILIDSVEQDDVSDQESIEQAWIEVAKQRLEEIRTGKVQCRPFEDVVNELRARYQ